MRKPDPLLLDDDELGLVTDLYQLTMLAAYRRSRRGVRGVFELWFRSLPPERNFLIAAGLEPAIAYLLRLRFPPRQVASLRGLAAFSGLGDEFFSALRRLHFTGDVWGVREGTVIFAGEPVLRVEAPIEQAQLAETYLLAAVSYSTLVASKAARIRLAAGEREVVDFGSRRAHGPQAACWAARAAYLGGLDATSNVWAACRLQVPVAGTMAHSFVLAFAREEEAFRAYAQTFPGRTVLLVDTFDTIAAVERAAADPELGFVAIRLDSGDITALATACRRILDAQGRREVRIVASGDLDEWRIAAILGAGAPVDAFGVGTRLVTSADVPNLQAVYKLVAVEEPGKGLRGVAKRSTAKRNWPGPKQIWRRRSDSGEMLEDLVTPAGQGPAPGPWEPLLEPWVTRGRLTTELPTLDDSRSLAKTQLAGLPKNWRGLGPASAFPVAIAPALQVEG
ncbi:MAG: nicotinate phosphoribosyltransferase [Thermoanaerobaculales bacterium]